jgi:DNA-binding MarR family transcriptional regulator
MDAAPLSTPLSQVLVAHTIELDNEFERRLAKSGGGARVTSLVMWSNFLRFVGDGIAVGELPAAAGLQEARMLSTLGGMERWRYVFVAPPPADERPSTKRAGYGSARGFRGDWLVRLTPVGRKAQEIWRQLFGVIEARWEERFGEREIDELRNSLRAIVDRLDVELPESLPIMGSANGLAVDIPPAERRGAAPGHLHGLLSQVLLAYAIDFERESDLSLLLSANFARVLDETGMLVRDLPLAAGVSKEATSIALTSLTKTGHVTLEGSTAATRKVRLTPKGRQAKDAAGRLHDEVESRWGARFGADDVRRPRRALQALLKDPVRLARGMRPHADGWRASKPYLARTEAVLADPVAALPQFPMVLYRGGWPDGS